MIVLQIRLEGGKFQTVQIIQFLSLGLNCGLELSFSEGTGTFYVIFSDPQSMTQMSDSQR